MIKYVTGDLFQSGAECLVNTVNCEGYMGKGVAYQFKLLYPDNNKAYVKACREGSLTVGSIFVFVERGTTIVNFPTKNKWRESSKIQYIEDGLDVLIKKLPEMGVKSMAFPPLGCGNGGLDWRIVKPLLQKKLQPIEEEYVFLIYEPGKNYSQKAVEPPKLSASSLVLMKLSMKLKNRGKLRLQKAAYFTNVFWGREYFSFQRHIYGPYAHSIEIISREIAEYQKFYNLENTERTYQMLYQTLCSEKVIKLLDSMEPAIEKAAEYVNQIVSLHDLEGLSTVLYLALEGNPLSKEALLDEFKMWSEDKATRFRREEILGYIDYLEKSGLLRPAADGYEFASSTDGGERTTE